MASNRLYRWGGRYDVLRDSLSLEELRVSEAAEERRGEFAAEGQREAVARIDARTSQRRGDPMDDDPLLDDNQVDRYWRDAADRMNGVA
jgi:hypothetical protein